MRIYFQAGWEEGQSVKRVERRVFQDGRDGFEGC